MLSYSNKRSFLGVFILIFGMAFFFAACETQEEPVIEDPMEQEPMQEEMPGISELEGDPLQYVGQTVTVTGDVDEVFSDSVFTVSGGLFTGSIPVIMAGGMPAQEIMQGDEVQITGTVRNFVATEIESEYGFDLDPTIETEFEENEAVIIAETVTPTMQESPGMEDAPVMEDTAAAPGNF